MISVFKAKGYVFVPKTTSTKCEKVFVKLHTRNTVSSITVEFFPKCIMFGKGLHFTGYSYIYDVWATGSCCYDLQHTIQELLCEKGIRLTDVKLPKAYSDEEYENLKTLTDSLEMLYRMSEASNALDGIVVF